MKDIKKSILDYINNDISEDIEWNKETIDLYFELLGNNKYKRLNINPFFNPFFGYYICQLFNHGYYYEGITEIGIFKPSLDMIQAFWDNISKAHFDTNCIKPSFLKFINNANDIIRLIDNNSFQLVYMVLQFNEKLCTSEVLEHLKGHMKDVIKECRYLTGNLPRPIIFNESLLMEILDNNAVDLITTYSYRMDNMLSNKIIFDKFVSIIPLLDFSESSISSFYQKSIFQNDLYVKKQLIKSNFYLNNLPLMHSVSQDIHNGLITVDDNNLRVFYDFIYEIGTGVIPLIRTLISNNINNINLLFNENGITDYFLSYLVYNKDYILKYHGTIKPNDKNHQAYIELVLICPLIADYINKNNITNYLEDGYIKRIFIDELLSLKKYDVLLSLANSKMPLPLNNLEKYIILKANTLNNSITGDFISYCFDHINELDEYKVDKCALSISKFENSASRELNKQYRPIVKHILDSNDIELSLKEMEDYFEKDNIPEFLRRFAMYKIKYPINSNDPNINSRYLKYLSSEDSDRLIMFDLLRASLGSSNSDLINYLHSLVDGDNLFLNVAINKDRYNELSDKQKILLNSYRNKIEFFARYYYHFSLPDNADDIQMLEIIKEKLDNKLGVFTPHLADQIFKDIFSKFGMDGILPMEVYAYKNLIMKTSLEEGNSLNNRPLEIKYGDFMKGVDSRYLDNILINGSISVEMLGEDSNQDSTHLDTDMSLITDDNPTIKKLCSSNMIASHWENMKLIISREYMDKYSSFIDTTNVNNKEDLDLSKINAIEGFRLSSDHYCIRTGFPSTSIKAIIYDAPNIDREKFIIVKNGFYIPIYNSSGDLRFSYDEYSKLSKLRYGLKKYLTDSNYPISDNLESSEVLEVENSLKDNNTDSNNKRQAIYRELNKVFSKYFKGVKYSLNKAVETGVIEIFDTGSTGRGTNVPNDSDFDFIMRLDKSFRLDKNTYNEFIQDIYKVFNKPNGGDTIRLTDVFLEGVSDPLQIEITIVDKTNKIDYSTEECIKDRLSTIAKLHPDKYHLVIANIIEAKRLFKKYECYKPRHASKNAQGGLGGIGTENWILQHGGSLYDAAKSFLETYEKYPNLNDFQQHYPIYDFGQNHLAEKNKKYYYDNFIYNLNETGFQKLVIALKSYVNGYEVEHNDINKR